MSRTAGATSTRRPVTDTRQKVWNSIRVLKRFTSAQIEATAEVGQRNLNTYIRALSRAGYLALVRPRQSGKSLGHAIWRLSRDSGPQHPLPRRDGSGVYDPNQDTLYPYRDEASDGREPGRMAGGLENRLR